MMKPIKMVDLKGQYDRIKDEIDGVIREVVESTAFINGPAVGRFQKNLEAYLGVKHVIPCANGTDALQIAMMAAGLKPGDEVITVSFTFVSTVEVIALLGLKPVLVDVMPDTFNMDTGAVKKAITPHTRAIVPVHLFGQCVDMEPLMQIAREHDLIVIEDACQAIGADYRFSDQTVRKAGTIGDIGAVSFFPSKNLGAYGDGGALFTNSDELAHQMRGIVNHGMFTRYYYDYIGVNSRLDSIQAGILDVKLRYLDGYARSRQQAADYYDRGLRGDPTIKIPYRAPYSSHVFHQYTLQIEGADRNALQQFLKQKGIPAMIYYPVPLHLQKAYVETGCREGVLPVTEALCHKVLSLPMHTELDHEQQDYIIASIHEYLNTN
ncbi:MAG: DegT/DnrJ/EryC1/StrS family aminotransferase [Bacteroidales bacterium]|nr:DegT/DnrJ/EryC1/StrS family aminotransferase [Bacteroidales bacterium]